MGKNVPMRPTIVLRPSRSRLAAIAVSCLAAALLVLEVVSGGPVAGLRALPWLGLLTWCCWMLWGVSTVRLGPDGLVVDNPLTRHTVPWQLVSGARAEWGLVVEATGHEVRAWAVPSKSGHAMVSTSIDGRTTVVGGRCLDNAPQLGSRFPESRAVQLDLGAGAAAELLRQEATLRATGNDAAPVVHRSLHRGRLGLLVALALLCALTIL